MSRTYIKDEYSKNNLLTGSSLTLIRDWKISPDVIIEEWILGAPTPNSRLGIVVFPELDKLKLYDDITDFRHTVDTSSINVDVLELKSQGQDFNNLTIPADGQVNFIFFFKNFNLLTSDVSFDIKYAVYGTNKNGVELELESRTQKVTIKVFDKTSVPYVSTDKPEYFLEYNIDDKVLSGDKKIRVVPHNFTPNQLSTPTIDCIDPSFSLLKYQNSLVNPFEIYFDINSVFILKPKKHIFNCNVSVFTGEKGLHSIVTTSITIHLDIVQNNDDFQINTSSMMSYLLKQHENKKAEGFFELTNNSGLAITFETSSWITINYTNNKVSFETKPAKELNLGINNGFIKITSPNTVKVVRLDVMVVSDFDSTLSSLNFCLDGRKIVFRQKTPEALFVRLKLEMNFVDFDKESKTVIQEYDAVFFNEEVVLYPGEEVQDFFKELNSIKSLIINDSSNSIPVSQELFYACKTIISFTERDRLGNEYESFTLEPLLFLPGKKPLAFPYLTNAKERSTYTNSLISVCSLKNSFIDYRLGEVAGNLINNTALSDSRAVANICFRRFIADRVYGDREIIEQSSLSLHPIPNSQEVIDVLFQNQNFCIDWFSFSGEWEEHNELSYIIADNILSGNEKKINTDKKTTIKLNTGWILEEEVTLLTELMESPVCFIFKNNEWLKCIPISKKPLPYNSMKNINSQIVEFKLISDER